jgi:hypothetical protein
MKTLKEKLAAYKRLFKVTYMQTVTEGPTKAAKQDPLKKEVLN